MKHIGIDIGDVASLDIGTCITWYRIKTKSYVIAHPYYASSTIQGELDINAFYCSTSRNTKKLQDNKYKRFCCTNVFALSISTLFIH